MHLLQGLSSVTPREAIEIADRFKSSAGQVVLYRRIVSELIKQTDENNNNTLTYPTGYGAGNGNGISGNGNGFSGNSSGIGNGHGNGYSGNGNGNGNGKDASLDVLLDLMNRSGAHMKGLSEAFALFDRKQSGAVRAEDLKAVFNEAKVKIRSKELELLIGWLFLAIYRI